MTAVESEHLILKPFDKLPLLHTATILLIGSEGVGKHDLAKSIVGIDTDVSYQVRTAVSLPLASNTETSRPRIDFACFLIDVTNKESFNNIEESLKYIDGRYFLGRACFVALKVKNHASRCVHLEVLTSLADYCGAPILYGGLETDAERMTLARQILTMTEIAAGFKKNISPGVIEATKVAYNLL
ncbi:centromere protein M-like [Ylistrum balloti]|uniref:centromere protein M-like n=1 Tax=Ylistrum balloti TaxID=509963 RepID=UPI002905F441|nr:centromere protein M-like [Ylistrum balloti]